MIKKTFLPVLFLPTMFLASSTVTTNVDVISNTSNQSTTEGSSHTYIKTTTNGESTVVESNESGEIRVKSENGKTTVTASPGMKVNVNNETTEVKKDDAAKSSPSANKSNQTFKSPENKVKSKINESRFEIKEFWQNMQSTFKAFFSKLHF